MDIAPRAALNGRNRAYSRTFICSNLQGAGRTYIIIIIMNFYNSPVSNTRCHSIGHKMRIARIKIRVDSPGRWARA